MNMLFFILPFVISIFVVFIKRKIVNAQSGKKFVKREMFLDGFKTLAIAFVAMLANFLIGKDIPIWTILIDVFMMIVYLLPLLEKNYDYIERKALTGILASCIFMMTILIAIFQMLIGTYDNEDTTLLYCFIKGVCYFSIAIWTCFTTGKEKKIEEFFWKLKSSLSSYKINNIDYYMFAFLELFIFCGANGSIHPVGIFGIHEILNKKKVKGITYIVLGNICIFLNYKYQFIGSIISVLYTFVALVDLCIQFIRYRKNKAL